MCCCSFICVTIFFSSPSYFIMSYPLHILTSFSRNLPPSSSFFLIFSSIPPSPLNVLFLYHLIFLLFSSVLILAPSFRFDSFSRLFHLFPLCSAFSDMITTTVPSGPEKLCAVRAVASYSTIPSARYNTGTGILLDSFGKDTTHVL